MVSSLRGRWVAHFFQRVGFLVALAATASAQITITAQPNSVTTLAGTPATFSVTATSSGTPTYQWRRNGYALPGATQSSFTLSAVSQGDNDLYDVVVTSGSAATTSQPARLLVTLPSYPNGVVADLTHSLRLEGPNATPGTLSALAAVAALPDGRYYIAGVFSTVSNQKNHDIVRVTANGAVDPTFSPPAFDVAPRSLALQPDGKLIVGGLFKTVGGASIGGIVRLNSDGSIDPTFQVGTGFSIGPTKVFVTTDGSIYATGFVLGNYHDTFVTYIAKLSSTGALDTTFVEPTFTVNGSGTNPLDFAVTSAGLIYVNGGFDSVSGVPRNRIARLLRNGTVDPSFNPGAGPNSFLYAMVALSNGQLVLGGDFTAYNGTTVGRIARINADGSLDRTFATGSGFSNQVNFLAELPNNNLFVGAIASQFNGVFVPSGVRLTSTGSLDSTFIYNLPTRPDALASLPGSRLILIGYLDPDFRPGAYTLETTGATAPTARLTFRFPARARVLAHLANGKIFVAGDFSSADGVAVPYVMRLNADLTRDTTFPKGAGPTALVVTGTVQPDGKIILLTYSGMMRLNADGSTDSSFSTVAPSGYWFPSAPVVLPDGRIFVATTSSLWGASNVTNGFVILDANGARITTHPLLPGPPAGSTIGNLHLLPNGQMLVTGTFTSWNGVNRAKAVRLRTDGSVDTGFTLDRAFTDATILPYTAPYGPTVQRDVRVIAMTDRSQSAPILARFNGDGSRDSSFAGSQPAYSDAGRLLVQPDDRVIVMGQGQPTISGDLPIVVTRFTRDGAVDPTFSVDGSGFWNAALLTDAGELLVNDSSGYLIRFIAAPKPVIDVQPAGQTVSAGLSTTLRVTAHSGAPLTYQWTKDGVPIPGATNSILSLDGVSSANAGSYTVTVINSSGSVTSAAAVVTVSARPVAGVYFGTVQDGDRGQFALYIRSDGSGVFLGWVHNGVVGNGVFTSLTFTLDANRHFHFTPAVAPTIIATDPVVDGTFAFDGSVTGTVNGFAFSAPPAISNGPGTFTGFYRAGAAGSDAVAYMIVAPDNTFFDVVTAFNADAGQGTLDASGSFSVTNFGAAFRGAVESGAVRWSAAWSPPVQGNPTITFSGANDDRRTDTEKLINISTRCAVSPGGGSFTAGFVVAGNESKPVLIRAIGPSLGLFQLPGALPAAHLEVYRGSTLIAIGNDWGLAGNASQVAATAIRVGAFALPLTSRDAALVLTLTPGSYSVVVSGQDQASGIALAEVYDATDGVVSRAQRVINISTLAAAGTGANALVAGFVISGSVPKRVLVRGAGPALAAFGVNGPLAQPQVKVYSGTTVLAQNAGWTFSNDPGALANAAHNVGAFAFPARSNDAALLINLAPGQYTAEVSSLDGVSGTALVEIYEAP